MTIQRVAAGTTRDFSTEEYEAIRENKSSSKVLGTARQNAGQRGEPVVVRGDDKTLDQKLEDKKTHISVGEAIGSGIHAVEIGGAVAHAPKFLHGPKFIVALGVATFVGAQVALAEMQHTKDDIRDAATKDTLRAGMLLSLELPSGYVAAEVERLGVSTANTSPSIKIKNQIVDTPLAASLQLHCDQGVAAAEDFLVSGQSKESFLKVSPKVAQRYAEDPAFKAGFDALVWAKANAPADAKQLVSDVHSRDARYHAVNIHIRS